MKPPLLALTLWPEWAYAITHLGKDVENRDWERLPTWLTGRYLAIHAGAHIGGGRRRWRRRRALTPSPSWPGARAGCPCLPFEGRHLRDRRGRQGGEGRAGGKPVGGAGCLADRL